jgi:zinc finger protein
MAAESEKQNFFEPIGNKAQGLSTNANGDSTEEEFKPVDEIESLCMNCHENVSRFALLSLSSQRYFILL